MTSRFADESGSGEASIACLLEADADERNHPLERASPSLGRQLFSEVTAISAQTREDYRRD